MFALSTRVCTALSPHHLVVALLYSVRLVLEDKLLVGSLDELIANQVIEVEVEVPQVRVELLFLYHALVAFLVFP